MNDGCPDCGTPAPALRNAHAPGCARRPCSCGTAVDEYHHDHCGIARCAVTGEQRVYRCGASGDRYEGDCAYEPGTDCRTVWRGALPGRAEAQEYGMWVRYSIDPTRNPSVVYTRTAEIGPGPGLAEDLSRVYTECVWDRDAQRYVLPEHL